MLVHVAIDAKAGKASAVVSARHTAGERDECVAEYCATPPPKV